MRRARARASESAESSPSSSPSGSHSDSRSGSASSSSGEEPTTILGTEFHLPRDLCENADIFREFMSAHTWDTLSEAECRHLRRFLPSFPEDDAEEKDVTLRRLFARDTFRFGSPLVQFQKRLAAGTYRQDSAARLRAGLAASRRRRAKRRRKRRWRREFQPVMAAREILLTLANTIPPTHRLPPTVCTPPPSDQIGPAARARAHRRYFQELAAIHYEIYGESGGMSDDDNYPEGPPPPLSKQHRNYLNQLQGGNATVFSTLGQGYHIMSGMTSFTDEWKRNALSIHRRRRIQQPNNCELNTRGITLSSIRSRIGDSILRGDTKFVSSNGKQIQKSHNNRRSSNKTRKLPSPSDSGSDEESNQAKVPPVMNIPTPTLAMNSIVTTLSNSITPSSPITCKIENNTQDNSEIDDEAGLQLVQATHACFLSVIRDLVCNTARHCLPLVTLEVRLRNWRQNPIAPLNHWYSSVEDWLKVLPSAISFLTGESSSLPDEFVPYLQYKPTTQVYQWIGAGRDSDSLLMPLCAHWLSHRQSTLNSAIVPVTTAPIIIPSPAAPLEIVEGISAQSKGWNNRYTMSPEELESFRKQEAARFQRPHRAFTYHLSRTKVVVGPLKGVYGCDEPGTNNARGARGHTLLTATRPRHVTLLALVRDAVACLPGGEGTRAHITTLLRRSQYLVPDAGEQALQAAVSGALDRMHGSPDPCVHYLPARKLWVYLHTDRTEEEFERLHAETQKNKTLASIQQKRNVTNAKTKPVRPVKPLKPTNTTEVINTTVSIDEDGNSEDVHVDVESTEVPTLALSMQTPSPVLSVSPAPPPLHMEKIIPAVSVMSGTSLLQPRAPILASTMLKRSVSTVQVSSPRSVVRVLSSTSTSGKSLISPQALQSTTPVLESTVRPVISQAKLVVQKPSVQTTGALTPVQQKRLLESLMRHQRQHGQPMSHDQLLHTINSTQKMSSSTPTTSTQMSVVVSKPVTTSNQTLQLTGQTVQLPSGQTVQLTGQTMQLTSQTVQLTGQTVQLGGQTVQIGGQTVQLAGQSVQLVEQNRAVGDSVVRPSTQRQGPLMAKILTSAQLRNSGNINIANTATGLRLSGLSLAQLQGKPLLLQNATSTKSSNILLQTGGNITNPNTVSITGNAERLAGPRQATPTTQHTLLLSNIGGQVVRVAGSGAILGSTLRLQTPSNTVQGSSGVLLGSHSLKLQGSPIRLHQAVGNANSPGRVLLTGGTRLHSLKLLPVHHSIAKSGNVGGRQVYARIVNPATANVVAANSPGSSGLVVGIKPQTPATTEPSVISAQNSQPPNR